MSRSEAQIVAGADRWAKLIKRRNYRADNLVRLVTVATDLGTDTGETIEVLPGTDRKLGPAWTRPGGVASFSAYDLGVPWWIGTDGVTRFGARPELKRIGCANGFQKGKISVVAGGSGHNVPSAILAKSTSRRVTSSR